LPYNLTNYYTILKVSEEATADEIKLAYRALAKEFHPDINPNNIFAEEYFKKINEAYDVLKDPIKRNWYNLLLRGNTEKDSIDPRKYGTRGYTTESRPKPADEVETPKTPFWMPQLVLSLCLLWCLLIIYNNWFITYEGAEPVKIVFAYLLFIVCCYFFINNKYNEWRKQKTTFNAEERSLRYFLILFFLTLPAFFAVGWARKSIQLYMYPKETEAIVVEYKNRFDEYWANVIYFNENYIPYSKEITFTSPVPLKKSDYKVLIKYSKIEPKIMKFYIQLLQKDTTFQIRINEVNSSRNYFTPATKVLNKN